MAGVFNLNTDGRKISGDSASLFDEKSITSPSELGSSTSPSLPLSPQPLRLSQDNFINGFQTSGTLLDGILQNLSIWDDTRNQKKKYFCTCGDGIDATSYCSVCKDYLCDKCVSAHNRVKVTRDHLVQRIDSQATEPLHPNDLVNPDSLQVGRPFQFMCDEHPDSPLHLYCIRCSVPICGRCALESHNNHRVQFLQKVINGSKSLLRSLISQSKTKNELLEKTSGHILTQIKAVEAQSNDIFREIKTAFHKIKSLLEQRERELITSVQQLQQIKFQTLNSRYDEICKRTDNLKKITEDVKREVEYSNGIDVLKAKERLEAELIVAEQSLARNTFQNDENVSFVLPDSVIMDTVSQLGKIVTQPSSPSPPFLNPMRVTTSDTLASLAVGSHFSHAGENENKQKRKRDQGVPLFSNHPLLEKQDFSPPAATFHENKQVVSSDLREILSGPPGPTVRLTKPRFSFGGMGENDGQLCRPWGVACDRNGNFIVADRSNNRIQIFSSSGTFVRKFGVAGSHPGQFNRPAGLSVDIHDRIVVADKDNHRIQIFSLAGEFIFAFGERGSKNSQFYYPWDIATDSRGLVAVTDTRNHRIQIFDGNGKFLGKYGFEGLLWKHFDSPRGIYFANNDTSLVVTDFNNHRLVIIQSDLQSARFLGSEGSQLSQFTRPQGVAVDGRGNYIVADSRNNRLQIFSPSGTIIAILGGTQGSASDEMDRPSGVAVAPDGGVAVVDFGNNRVLVY